MPVDVDFPEPDDEEPDKDEFLADDDTPVEAVTPEQKKAGWPKGQNKLQSQQLSAEIWEEYAAGMTQKKIAELHGMTQRAVSNRIDKYQASLGIEDVVEAKAKDLGRYESLLDRLWGHELTPEIVRTIAMLLNQRAKLLGLNAPKRLTVEGEMSLTPTPALTAMLERVQKERLGTTEVKQIEGDVVEAELVDGD